MLHIVVFEIAILLNGSNIIKHIVKKALYYVAVMLFMLLFVKVAYQMLIVLLL